MISPFAMSVGTRSFISGFVKANAVRNDCKMPCCMKYFLQGGVLLLESKNRIRVRIIWSIVEPKHFNKY